MNEIFLDRFFLLAESPHSIGVALFLRFSFPLSRLPSSARILVCEIRQPVIKRSITGWTLPSLPLVAIAAIFFGLIKTPRAVH